MDCERTTHSSSWTWGHVRCFVMRCVTSAPPAPRQERRPTGRPIPNVTGAVGRATNWVTLGWAFAGAHPSPNDCMRPPLPTRCRDCPGKESETGASHGDSHYTQSGEECRIAENAVSGPFHHHGCGSTYAIGEVIRERPEWAKQIHRSLLTLGGGTGVDRRYAPRVRVGARGDLGSAPVRKKSSGEYRRCLCLRKIQTSAIGCVDLEAW